jgi:putative chitinase
MIERELFEKYFKDVEDKSWIDSFYNLFIVYQINTKERICHFLAQVFHETNFLNVLEEDLHYSAIRLLKIFPKYFNKKTAILYQKNPQKIANKVYANRMGNGDEKSGDGYKFRGRGIFQLTGKENYIKFKCINNPDGLIKDKDFSIRVACDYFIDRGLMKFADANNFKKVRKGINGGEIGFEDCKAKFEELYKI